MMNLKSVFRRMLAEAVIIAILALATSLGVNYLRTDQLRLFGTDCLEQTRVCHAEAKKQETIGIEECTAFFLRNAAVFIDARSPVAYMLGHIPGAINIPVAHIDTAVQTYLKDLSPETMIVVYDGDSGGNVGADVAQALRSFGFQNIVLFPNGWNAWQNKGLPIEIGMKIVQ